MTKPSATSLAEQNSKNWFKDNPKVAPGEVEVWLRRNPPPPEWTASYYEYALLEMPVGKFYTWWRRNMLAYPI